VVLQCCPLSHPLFDCYSSSNISLLSDITMLSSITSAPLLLQFTQHQFAQWYYNVVLYHIRAFTVTVHPTSVCWVNCNSKGADVIEDNIVISLSKLMLEEL
jgi:hypothetical protein